MRTDLDLDPARAGTDQAATRVLVVDDDDAQRDLMTRLLRRAGYAVFGAASGADAVEVARAFNPDVAVIDVFLGDSGGLGVARVLREELAALRVLFVTGLPVPAVRAALAPALVLAKPFSRAALLGMLRRLAPAP